MRILFLLLLLSGPLAAQTTYLHCGRLLDVRSGKILEKMTIVVKGEVIHSVESGYLKPSEGVQVVDLQEQTVLPGLIDCHVHIEWEQSPRIYLERYILNEADIAFRAAHFARITLDAGFTTIRDLGGTGVNVALRDAIASGIATGPRILTSRKSIAITGGHADPTNGARADLLAYPGPEDGVADGPDACRQAVRHQVKYGADCIKITATGGVLSVARDGYRPQFTLEEMQAVVQTARDQGVHVAAHAHGDEGIYRAVLAGVTSIEHGTMLSDSTMDLMLEMGTYYVPTITAGKAIADSALIPGFFPVMVAQKALFIGPQLQTTFGKAYKKGLKIAFGTDAGVFPHGNNALEFVYMTEAGMPPLEAIRSATLTASELLGLSDRLGAIEPGKWADIIAVPKNPLEDIATLQQVSFVMKGGKVFKG